jgi:iron only hydrogenase large subunit-like protein
MCVNVCPYKAITKRTIPCEDSCPVGAIHKDDTGFSTIDFDKCINCGRCISRCPFGAVHEKSQIIDILKMIKSSKKVVAMIAPSIVGQFNCTLYQLKTALIKAGFDEVVEVAQGADITATREAKEFLERMESGENFMTTSCCAGYNQLANKHLQEIKPYISDTKTPMYYTAEIVKAKDEDCISVFVTPCVAKRAEAFDNKNVDFVMNYEELNALFEAREIDYQKCEETPFEKESSKQARNFGITGGVADSVKKALKEEDKVKPCVISGINKDSIKQLKKCATTGKCADGNLIEVMCCEGGCISGNATLNNSRTAKKLIDNLLANSQDIEKI